ncbi:YbfB/YjiJ family MFS transporter [Glaciibacter superstes]|uniref:YbfB/YjiJ family MFS transporter n=1 Tax=Glaciibacter superstes TaxID=501023 RepID=UPI0003B632A0|nr:YbfB/YjiJ family MFS transporter [Glaciibacter superstes]
MVERDDTFVPKNSRPRWGLTRYVAAATLARAADGGGVVAIILVVSTSGAPGWLTGLLGASITAPHLLGPFIARRLDTARDGRNVIAFACLIHGATLAAAVLLYPVVWPILTALLLFASGLFGPFLTGGISSRLPAIASQDQHGQRRAQGWDVATYGLGATIGPSIVAIVSVWSTPTIAALVLAGGTFAAAALVRLLPYAPAASAAADVPRPLRTLRIMAASGPLRRTLYLTMIVALSVAVLPIVAVSSTASLGEAAGAAAALVAAYGIGSLAGSVGVMIRPLRRDADVLMPYLALIVAAALVAVLLAPNLTLAVVAYAAAGIANSYFFAATLAARSEYSPAAARGQIFIWVGALKITAGSAGTAAAGALIGTALHLPTILAAGIATAAAVVAIIDRRFSSPGPR